MTRDLRGEFRRPVLHPSSHFRGAAWQVHGGDINKSPQNGLSWRRGGRESQPPAVGAEKALDAETPAGLRKRPPEGL